MESLKLSVMDLKVSLTPLVSVLCCVWSIIITTCGNWRRWVLSKAINEHSQEQGRSEGHKARQVLVQSGDADILAGLAYAASFSRTKVSSLADVSGSEGERQPSHGEESAL